MIKRIILILALVCFMGLSYTTAVSAYDPFSDGNGTSICSAGAGSANNPSNSAVCKSRTTGDPVGGPHGVLAKITTIISYFAGVVAVVLILISGLRYITSGGDSAKVSSAKNTLVNTLIGIAVVILAREIIFFALGNL
ncbi:MAG: hypothetical protein NVS1B10_04480 [Candidatus Saccharimonadales bacterium]